MFYPITGSCPSAWAKFPLLFGENAAFTGELSALKRFFSGLLKSMA